jgi:hypothetical protein
MEVGKSARILVRSLRKALLEQAPPEFLVAT